MTASHQTVRLSRGRHATPEEGVCVMELASMLAGEPFTDRPRSVCPVIGAFLRIYNDRLDDEYRQDLYRFAAESVGTAAGPAVVMARVRACEEFAERMGGRRPSLLRRLGQGRARPTTPSGAGVVAARSIGRITRERHLAALAHVERLIAAGSEQMPPVKDAPEARPSASVATSGCAKDGLNARSRD